MYQHSVSAEPESTASASPEVAADARADEAVATQTGETAQAADLRDPSHPFRDELARAMQAAAQRERLRIEGRIDDDANSHVGKVRTRASVEADELKRLAEDDVSRIRTWCKAEVERIRAEADIQVAERRDRLEEHLGQHASIIDGEIDRVAEAVEGYRHELEVFFVGLATVKDPSEIARLADAVPGPPDFELIRAIARADAVGRLSDLEAASESEMPTSAVVAMDEDAIEENSRPIDSATPVDASTDRDLVPVMDPALAPVAQAPAAEATPVAEPTPTAAAVPADSTAAPELVPVMDPAIAPVAETQTVGATPATEPEAFLAIAPSVVPTAPAEIKVAGEGALTFAAATAEAPTATAAPAEAPIASTAEELPVPAAAEPVAVMDPALAEKAEAEAIADAAATAAPELVTAGATGSEPNAATRFLRSLTAWGSSDHGNNGHK